MPTKQTARSRSGGCAVRAGERVHLSPPLLHHCIMGEEHSVEPLGVAVASTAARRMRQRDRWKRLIQLSSALAPAVVGVGIVCR
jgi:hypothetical protein